MLKKLKNNISGIKKRMFAIIVKEFNRKLFRAIVYNGNWYWNRALYNPMSVNKKKAKVIYIDRMDIHDLRKQYPELKDYDLVRLT